MLAYKIVVTTLYGLGAFWFALLTVNAVSWRSWKLVGFYVGGIVAYVGLIAWTVALTCP